MYNEKKTRLFHENVYLPLHRGVPKVKLNLIIFVEKKIACLNNKIVFFFFSLVLLVDATVSIRMVNESLVKQSTPKTLPQPWTVVKTSFTIIIIFALCLATYWDSFTFLFYLQSNLLGINFSECSRISSTINSLINSRYPQYSVRCLDDGSFDPLHCIDAKCICLNSTDGTVTKNKIYNVNSGSGSSGGTFGSDNNNNAGGTSAISIADFNKLPCCKYFAGEWRETVRRKKNCR